jgi:glycosyltransferase involved in cell wall biosynthesis
MRSNPLVSVIIIFYNAERFFREAIESVLAQTYPDWELLLVDDGSTDASSEIALEYQGKYPEKVRYLEHNNHDNRGMSASRNLGVKNASGKYVAMLDADDIWLAEKLTEQIRILESHPEADMLCGSTLYWYSWTGKASDLLRDHQSVPGVQPGTLIKPLACLALNLWGKIIPFTNDMIMLRRAYNDVGGFEEVFTGHYEERAFFIKFSLRHSVFVTSNCWSKYRQHPNSSSAIVLKLGQKDALRQFYLNWVAAYLSEQKLKNVSIWTAILKAMAPYLSPKLSGFVRSLKKLFGMYPQLRRNEEQPDYQILPSTLKSTEK